MKNLGHEVAIVTGRPYRNSKQYYDQLNLGGPIANFNGALCHIPGMPDWDGKYHITLDSESYLIWWPLTNTTGRLLNGRRNRTCVFKHGRTT